jgi:hypothetical protein
VVLLVLVISYASSLRIFFAQTEEIADTRAELAQRQDRIEVLEAELARWNDSSYVRTQARERLGWVVPGEIGYRVVGADGKPLGGGAEITPEKRPAGPESAWWAKLWGSVEAADRPAPAPRPKPPPEPTITEETQPRSAPTPR